MLGSPNQVTTYMHFMYGNHKLNYAYQDESAFILFMPELTNYYTRRNYFIYIIL